MSEKCKKTRGALALCENAVLAWREGFIDHQTLRNNQTGSRRERLVLRKGKTSMLLVYCPWCRANIDTAPAERINAEAQRTQAQKGQ